MRNIVFCNPHEIPYHWVQFSFGQDMNYKHLLWRAFKVASNGTYQFIFIFPSSIRSQLHDYVFHSIIALLMTLEISHIKYCLLLWPYNLIYIILTFLHSTLMIPFTPECLYVMYICLQVLLNEACLLSLPMATLYYLHVHYLITSASHSDWCSMVIT